MHLSQIDSRPATSGRDTYQKKVTKPDKRINREGAPARLKYFWSHREMQMSCLTTLTGSDSKPIC